MTGLPSGPSAMTRAPWLARNRPNDRGWLSRTDLFNLSSHVPTARGTQNLLRAKTSFINPLNANRPVQSSHQKYSAWRVGQISRILSRIPSRQEGRIAIVTNVEAGSGGRETSQHSFSDADERCFADGQAAWSWRPKAGAKLAMMLRITRVTVTTKSGHRGERGVRRQTIAQGRPGMSG